MLALLFIVVFDIKFEAYVRRLMMTLVVECVSVFVFVFVFVCVCLCLCLCMCTCCCADRPLERFKQKRGDIYLG